MELVSSKDLVKASTTLQIFGRERLAKVLFRILKLDLVNKLYSSNIHLPSHLFPDKILEDIKVTYTVPEGDSNNIPPEGSFITISNHAYGGIDGLILISLITKQRPDYKVLVNFLLTQITPLQQYFIGVNPFETHKDVKSSFGGLKDAITHLSSGRPMGFFPAGEVSSYKLKHNAITDREWQHSMLKFIKKAEVPIVPVYFSGHNSIQFNILGFIHPVLRTVKLPSEIFNKEGKEIGIRIGTPITVDEQKEFKDIADYGRFLRMKTYVLGLTEKKNKNNYQIIVHSPEHLIEPVPDELIMKEIGQIGTEHLLFTIKENFVFCVPSVRIPHVLRELGRRREKTYREVGEGTNKSLDTDRYDPYFEQLFIWDQSAKQLVGGYRVGKGNHILTNYGMKGFYITSLFRINRKFAPILNVSLELGRSFIIKEYQKKPLSLFLLWKGILYLLLKNPNYRYLLGPVSISNEFRSLSKTLCVEFLKANYFNSEFAEYIKARNPFIEKPDRIIEKDLFLRYTEKDVGRLDSFINDYDPMYKTPVLLKKYLSVNAEVLGFNVDPLFNNCLDALMILDLFEVPLNTIEGLAKEFHDQSLLERFRK
ncbi:MAG: lysophospholipid acyltransferase family protein [Bacteroidetes bacterium]|nr:lysophospholipid acyltransferase family protein [Bacteroidota bacterium]